MVDHRGFDLDEIEKHVEDIIEIDDVYVPYQITGVFIGSTYILNKVWENQKEFRLSYREDRYWKKGETKYEMDQRLMREFVEVHPELECLVPKTGKTVEEAQNGLKKKYPEHIPYDFTPR